MKTRFLICAAVLALASATATPALAQAAAPLPRTLTVSGDGRADGVPDQAEITAGVVAEGATAAAAITANTAAMKNVFEALRTAGIAERAIQTSDFSVQPVYAQRRPDQTDPPRITGYRVSNQVRVEVNELASLGTTLDSLVRSGANQINSIAFRIKDPAPLAEQARKVAVIDAANKAATIAAAAGVRLGPILTISESGGAVPVPMMRMAAAEMSVPIAAGEVTVRATVTLTYLIE